MKFPRARVLAALVTLLLPAATARAAMSLDLNINRIVDQAPGAPATTQWYLGASILPYNGAVLPAFALASPNGLVATTGDGSRQFIDGSPFGSFDDLLAEGMRSGPWTLRVSPATGEPSVYQFTPDLSAYPRGDLIDTRLVAPAAGAALPTLRPTLQWEPVRGAAQYGFADLFSLDRGGNTSGAINASTTSWTPAVNLAPGRYTAQIDYFGPTYGLPLTSLTLVSGPDLGPVTGHIYHEFHSAADFTLVPEPSATGAAALALAGAAAGLRRGRRGECN